MAMKAMTDPGNDIEEQVNKTLSKKIRVAERNRPHVIQLWTAFQRTVQWRRSRGEKKPLAMHMQSLQVFMLISDAVPGSASLSLQWRVLSRARITWTRWCRCLLTEATSARPRIADIGWADPFKLNSLQSKFHR